jgi:hypothetical protein
MTAVIIHGTYSGYHAHRAQGESPCADCKRAKARKEKAYRERRRKSLDALNHPSHMAWDAGCRCEDCTTWHRATYRAYYNELTSWRSA